MTNKFYEQSKLIRTLSKYADAVIGSHSHVPQGHYYFKNKLIVPQLGNLLFPMHLTFNSVSISYIMHLISNFTSQTDYQALRNANCIYYLLNVIKALK